VDSYESWTFGANPLKEIFTEIGSRPTGQTTHLVWRWDPANEAPVPVDEFLITIGDCDV
jgi:hypothetical protein